MELIVIAGATATGKSELAIAVAKEINAEIINADSMQIYKGMDVGTAKLSLEDRGGLTHHLLDILEVSQDSTVAWYQNLAREKITKLHAEGKNVVVVGGTGLYIKSILDELNFPDTDPQVRKSLELEAEKIGADALFERLEKLDPAAAIAIDRANLRRVIRALEVIEITGKPFTANLPREESSRYPNAMQFGLVMERDHLIERIDARVEKMWQLGFVEEVKKCIENFSQRAHYGLFRDSLLDTTVGVSLIFRNQRTICAICSANPPSTRAWIAVPSGRYSSLRISPCS